MPATKTRASRAALAMALVLLLGGIQPAAQGYVLNYTVAASGGCPQPNRFNTATAGIVDRRWSTSLSSSPQTVLTAATDPDARLNEIEQSILRSFAVWARVSGTSLVQESLGPLGRTTTQSACQLQDGLNTLCFNQSSSLFTGGVLAFTRVVTSDLVGEQPFPNSPPSAFIGEILDADILFRPNDSDIRFATPAALPAHPSAFDLESVLIHELGHLFGFSHSGLWRAIMFPFAPPRGTFAGERPTEQRPDAPLADDDRVGLRVLYPNPADIRLDAVNGGQIRGRVVPVNSAALSGLPETSPGRAVTGIFGAHVVAVDADTGEIIAGVLAGWSCDPASPPVRFDGSFALERLPLGRNYKIYVEPLDGPVSAASIQSAVQSLCRSDVPQPCTPPPVNTRFTLLVVP
ncbi:MAG: matrixin family metalloprotease [Firmicutes bacterium]|nr:matrixin family metalloprotease [Bacillota bacterium]